MNIGSEPLRSKLRMIIHRPVGGVGQRPTRLSSTHAVQSGATIASGMVMTLVENATLGRLEWTPGFDAGALGARPNTFHFAVDDSTDGDVGAAGNFQGLSVRGDYELSSARFKAGETYKVGDPLTFDGVTGNLKLASAPTDIVIAHITEDYASPVDFGGGYVTGSLEPAEGGSVTPGVQGGVYLTGKHTNASNLELVRFETVQPYLLGAVS